MTISPLRLVLVLLVVGLLGWTWLDHVADQRDTAQRELATATTEVNGLRAAAVLAGEMLAARDQIDQQRTEELNHERAENAALRRDVDAGNQRLLVRATCSRPAMSASAGAGRVADAATAELAADARPDYFTLRDELALSREMILGLQDHIRQLCLRMPAQP
jgi:prophage endopeptidase